ncbi:MAG TPA: hypothetical protein VN667_13270 [Burkholderiales bacterium]|nr:hypothetical protein [Burkholderiales bacterium]
MPGSAAQRVADSAWFSSSSLDFAGCFGGSLAALITSLRGLN